MRRAVLKALQEQDYDALQAFSREELLDRDVFGGMQAAEYAVREEDPTALSILHQKGAIDLKGIEGRKSIVEVAIVTGHPEVLGFLADKGYDLQAPDANGKTPTELAAQYGNTKALKTLYEHNKIVGGNSEHLQDVAAKHDHPELAANLKENNLGEALHPALKRAMEGPLKNSLPEELRGADAIGQLKDNFVLVNSLSRALDAAIAFEQAKIEGTRDKGIVQQIVNSEGTGKILEIPGRMLTETMENIIPQGITIGSIVEDAPALEQGKHEINLRRLQEAKAEVDTLYANMDSQRRGNAEQARLHDYLDGNHNGKITVEELQRRASGDPTAQKNIVAALQQYTGPLEGSKDEYITAVNNAPTPEQYAARDKQANEMRIQQEDRESAVRSAKSAVEGAIPKKYNIEHLTETEKVKIALENSNEYSRPALITRLEAAEKLSPGFIANGVSATTIIAEVQQTEADKIALNYADKNKDGKLSPEEALAEARRGGTGKDFLKKLEQTDGRLGITAEQVKVAVEADKIMKEYVRKFDANGDGLVSKEEEQTRISQATLKVEKEELASLISQAKALDPELLAGFNIKGMKAADDKSQNKGLAKAADRNASLAV